MQFTPVALSHGVQSSGFHGGFRSHRCLQCIEGHFLES
jgi:hypothetical protein